MGQAEVAGLVVGLATMLVTFPATLQVMLVELVWRDLRKRD